ncbi:hypothetical protein EB008_03510 [bacterium]|nr:hypothetical protein [bacterium]
MANIPPNGLVRPTPVPQETDPSKTIPKITKVAIDIVSLSSEETNSTIPRATFNAREISSMSKEKTSQVASPYFRPRTTTALRSLALSGQFNPRQNPSDFELKEFFLLTLSSDQSDPALTYQKNLIKSIKDPNTLKEIVFVLIDRNLLEYISCFFDTKRTRALLFEILPTSEVENKISSRDLYEIIKRLIIITPEEEITAEIFENLSKKQFFYSFEMFKKITDPLKFEEIYPFLKLDFFSHYFVDALESDHLDICCRLAKRNPKKTSILRDFFLEKLPENPTRESKLPTLLLLINLYYYTLSLEQIESLKYASLDVGEEFSPELKHPGNITVDFVLFTLSTFFPSITKKIQEGSQPSSVEFSPVEFQNEIEILKRSNKTFTKILSLLSNPIVALADLEPISQKHIHHLPSIRPKHRQYSGSCVVKNLDSLLSMSFDAPSVLIWGGYRGHSVYAEIFKGENDQYFLLLHNLGESSEMHDRSPNGKIYPIPLFFDTFQKLENFIHFFRRAPNKEAYKTTMLSAPYLESGDLKKFKYDSINYKIAKALLERPEKPRPNPSYKNFRILQKKLLEKLAMTMNSTTPQEVITQAVKQRKILKVRPRRRT